MSRKSSPPLALLAAAALAAAGALLANGAAPSGAPPPRALELRTLGLAQLENEQPAEAAKSFAELAKLVPDDPLPHANLAVAQLRQQQTDAALAAIARALEKAPGRGDLLAIQTEALHWAGRAEEALAAAEKAMSAAPENLEVLYAAYRQATAQEGEAAERVAAAALERLARLRPENVVVLAQLGGRAVRRGDRAAATGSYLRIKELIWQAPQAEGPLEQLLGALESGAPDAARVPALRLENVLKVSAMYQQGLRELTAGIQGVPVERLANEPPTTAFGAPVPVELRATALDAAATPGQALAVADFDNDEKPDLARLRSGEAPTLEVRLAAGGWAPKPAGEGLDAKGLDGLLAVDLDNDGNLDLLAFGTDRTVLWLGKGDGSFRAAPEMLSAAKGATAAAAIDYDIEGDLDLALAGASSPMQLLRNALEGPQATLASVGDKTFPPLAWKDVAQLLATDLDRDGDLDLLAAHAGGLSWLDNLRQGRFADRTEAAGLGGTGAVLAAASADLDDDGLPDLVVAPAAGGLRLLRNEGGRFAPRGADGLPAAPAFRAVLAADLDNDGRLDIAAAGDGGIVALVRDGAGFRALPLAGAPGAATALAAADLDGDGDLDLLAAGPAGLHRLDNQGGNRNHWLTVRLRGLTKGNSKNNVQGVGSVVEVRAGTAYQFREAAGPVVHLGLGSQAKADLLRVVWPNGVPQNRLQPQLDQRIVEEQLLKGSCPFLYAWDGARMAFVTDLLWGAPIGLPVAPGVWAAADPDELVRVDGARPERGAYRLAVTEELWEAAFFDRVRLWVVDHPGDVEVASNLRVLPGRRLPDAVLASRALRPVAAAWDGAGRDVTARVARRDEVYASGFAESAYQGVAAAPWTFTIDLGAAPGAPVRIHLDGWVFPADASLNLALAQRRAPAQLFPRLEVETADGWRELLAETGFPAGKTKTMVLDTPPLPPGARRLRLVTSLWLAWDRVAWTTTPADSAPRVVARLPPAAAELRFRGFSRLVRNAPNAPHAFVYEEAAATSPWLPFPGRYTRYGDVRELLDAADDRSVVMAPGDEIALAFDAAALAPPAAGWRRTVFLESLGWDKDADRNTAEAAQVEPLPFNAMSGYPYAPGERFPDTPLHREYVERWLTRVVLGTTSAAR
ncbi:MAG TPA: FG-GAP-like repeat-containing protein [Thermoanaerobaculia bacterium]|nr:FG-GAP-like repeat-containing protein [Thermoanaerobaculia bacterium]